MERIEIPREGVSAKEVLGKLILVGISFYTSSGTFIEQFQTNGIGEIVEDDLLYLRRDDGTVFAIPYDQDYIKRAQPGVYSEKLTGKQITNPDFLSQWRIDTIDDLEHIERIKIVGFSGWGKDSSE